MYEFEKASKRFPSEADLPALLALKLKLAEAEHIKPEAISDDLLEVRGPSLLWILENECPQTRVYRE